MFLALSHISAGGIPSCWKLKDNDSQASFFSCIGNECGQSESVENICGNLVYLHWQQFVLNHDDDGCSTMWIPCILVQQIILSAFLGGISHFFTRNKWPSDGVILLFTSSTCKEYMMTKSSSMVKQLSLSITSAASYAYTVTELINNYPLAGVLGMTKHPL